MIRDTQEVVSAVRDALLARIGQERYDLWFGRQVRFDIDAQRLVVAAPDQFLLDRLRKQFRPDLAAAAESVWGREASLDFQVARQPAQPRMESVAVLNEPRDLPPAKAPKVQATLPLLEFASATASPRPARRETERLRTLDSFVEGIGNRVALTAAKSVCQRPGVVSPLFLYGPTGCGKSHLIQGICAAARHALGLRRVVSMSAEQFTSHFLAALQGSGLPSFRRKCRDVDVLAIDDVQFFAGKRATLVELQHTIDTLLRHGKQLLLAADRPPSELGNLGPELITRVSGGLVCGIEAADYDTRLGIARQLAIPCRRSVPDSVIELIASECTGDARQIAGALHRLDAAGEAHDEAITVEFARRSLEDIFRSTLRLVRLPDIERAVCEAFGLEPKTLRNGRKTKAVSHPRMLAMWLARKYTRAAFSEIGEYFGRRSHSTVISAEKKVNRWVADGTVIQLGHSSCTIDSAIRRLESQLRTA